MRLNAVAVVYGGGGVKGVLFVCLEFILGRVVHEQPSLFGQRVEAELSQRVVQRQLEVSLRGGEQGWVLKKGWGNVRPRRASEATSTHLGVPQVDALAVHGHVQVSLSLQHPLELADGHARRHIDGDVKLGRRVEAATGHDAQETVLGAEGVGSQSWPALPSRSRSPAPTWSALVLMAMGASGAPWRATSAWYSGCLA